ncbi:MAG: hypothetical protein ACR2FU_01055 [Streptosporangiaceae bacterium]
MANPSPVRLLRWRRLAIAGPVVAILAAAAVPGADAAAAISHAGAGAPGWPKLPATRNPATWPFSASSPWNHPIGYGVKYHKTTDGCTSDVRNVADGSDLATTQWSVPVYTESNASRRITIWDNNVSRSFASHLSPGARPAGPAGGDNDLAIINTSANTVDEMWHARIDDGRARVGAADYARYSLLGPGIGRPIQGGNQGVRAYGGSQIAGLIRRGELSHGIHHALAFSQPRNMQRPGWVWPATSQDSGGGYTGHVPIGQLTYIPRSNFSGFGLSAWGLRIARALHWYGAYDVDSGGGWNFYAQPSVITEIGQSGYRQIAFHDIPILRKLLVCVTNNGPHSVGGGGGFPPQLTPPPFKLGAAPGSQLIRPADGRTVPFR